MKERFVYKYDKTWVGVLAGLILPMAVVSLVFFFSEGTPGLKVWLLRVQLAHIVTHIIALCVFPNVLVFLLFNKLDMLNASKGVLGITVLWALFMLGIKLFQ